MSTNYTTNVNLCQWEATDQVLRTDFNADNLKIDAALQAVNLRVDDKASTSALDAVKTTLNGHASILAKKGNCKICTVSYTGNGQYGSDTPTVITFPGRPLFATITDGSAVVVLMKGMSAATKIQGTALTTMTVRWGTDSVFLVHSGNATVPMNESGRTYTALALIDTEA